MNGKFSISRLNSLEATSVKESPPKCSLLLLSMSFELYTFLSLMIREK